MPRTSVRKTSFKPRDDTRSGKNRAAIVAAARGYYPNIAQRGLQITKGEFKSIDKTVSSATLDTTGSVTLLNGCARGSDINEREGREITLRSLQLRLNVMVRSEAIVDQTVRILIVYDRQTNGTAPSVTDVISGGTVTGMRNLENRKRFKIIMDHTTRLNATYTGGASLHTASNNGYFHDFYKRFELPTTFNSGTAGTVADISTGSLYMVRIGEIAAGTAAAEVDFCSRVRYQDN